MFCDRGLHLHHLDSLRFSYWFVFHYFIEVVDDFYFLLGCLGKINFLREVLASFGFRTARREAKVFIVCFLVDEILCSMHWVVTCWRLKTLQRGSQHLSTSFVQFESEARFRSPTSGRLRWLHWTWPICGRRCHMAIWRWPRRMICCIPILYLILIGELQLLLLSIVNYLANYPFLLLLYRICTSHLSIQLINLNIRHNLISFQLAVHLLKIHIFSSQS